MCDEIELTEENFDKVLEPSKNILDRAALNKYVFDPKMKDRFVEGILSGKTNLEATPNSKGRKKIPSDEYFAYIGEYMSDNKSDMEAEFMSRVLEKIPKNKIEKYFDILVNKWEKGGQRLRESDEVSSLDSSIYQLFENNSDHNKRYIRKKLKKISKPLFNIQEVIHLLSVNKSLMILYFENLTSYCLENHNVEIYSSDIWLHRGIHLKKPFSGDEYIENRHLTSYTSSVSIMELFSQIDPNKNMALISAKLFDVIDRVFMFYGFVPNMPCGQQEIILIPSARRTTIKKVFQDKNLYEYELFYDGISMDYDKINEEYEQLFGEE